ncbi:unnamed protein product [Toxocara canis]|uniref:Uncharacterized protein n=1 Tax=Toxocara canis TaxID=6265 RepID=A0A183TWG4_TOXCA|nr:unnamed protein product [Toxocara canis]
MCRITILLIPWLYLALTTNAQNIPAVLIPVLEYYFGSDPGFGIFFRCLFRSWNIPAQSTSNEEVASALRVLLNANEYLKGGRLYNEFIRRQQALQDALRSSLSSPPTMPFVNVFEPVRNQLFNVLPQVSGGFLDRVSNGFNALVQPLPDGTLGTGGLLSGKEKRKEHFKENITELAKAAIKKVTKKIEPDRPREIPNVGGFGAEIRSINAVERVKNGSEDLSESSGNTEAPQLTRITLDDMEMRASDDYYDYIEHENSTPQSQFNDESAERTANATEFDGRQRDSAVRTADLPVSSIKNVDSSDAIISVADNSRTITRRAPRAQKTFGDEVDTDLYETAPMRPHYTLKENETIRQHKKPSHLHKVRL